MKHTNYYGNEAIAETPAPHETHPEKIVDRKNRLYFQTGNIKQDDKTGLVLAEMEASDFSKVWVDHEGVIYNA